MRTPSRTNFMRFIRSPTSADPRSFISGSDDQLKRLTENFFVIFSLAALSSFSVMRIKTAGSNASAGSDNRSRLKFRTLKRTPIYRVILFIYSKNAFFLFFLFSQVKSTFYFCRRTVKINT